MCVCMWMKLNTWWLHWCFFFFFFGHRIWQQFLRLRVYLACHQSSLRINVRLQLNDWSDPTVANKLSQHMASTVGHVPKVPQALFLTRRAVRNRHGSYSPKGDHMLFGILKQEAGLCQALYWISASVQAVCLFPRWASWMWPRSVSPVWP